MTKLALSFYTPVPPGGRCEFILERWTHSHCAVSKGEGQCLDMGAIIKKNFTFYNLLISGKSLTQCVPLQSQSKTARHQWAIGLSAGLRSHSWAVAVWSRTRSQSSRGLTITCEDVRVCAHVYVHMYPQLYSFCFPFLPTPFIFIPIP